MKQVFTSLAYGLKIQSEFSLLDPLQDDCEPDVVVRLRSLDGVDVRPNQGNEILVSLPTGLKIYIKEGREITVDVPAGVDLATVRAYILGSAMAGVLRQRGYFVLHASCVARNDVAIAFLGGSGWGKSTLATLFHRHGYLLLTDDVMAIQIHDGIEAVKQEEIKPVPLVMPSFPEVRLLPDAAAAVGMGEGRPRLQSLSAKQIQRLDQRFAVGPVPLRQLYILRLGERGIFPTPAPLAFTELVQHSRATKTMADPAFMVQHFQQCSRLIQTVPVSYLQRPRSLEQLPELIPLIEAHLSPSHQHDG